jgi:hypothetical protein
MQKIPEDADPIEVRDGVTMEVECVEADPEVAALASGYRAKVDEYQVLFAQIDPLHLKWIHERAVLMNRDMGLDAAVRGFRVRLMEMSGSKQSGPLFDRYFPEGLRAVTEADMVAAEPQAVGEIVEKLQAAGGALAQDWQPKLSSPLQAVSKQAVVLHAVEVQQDNLELRMDARVPELEACRVELHGRLRAHFKDDPQRAEAYFYRWRKPKRRRAPPSSSGTTPGPTP